MKGVGLRGRALQLAAAVLAAASSQFAFAPCAAASMHELEGSCAPSAAQLAASAAPIGQSARPCRCGGAGRVPCPEHTAAACAEEAQFVWCSALASCASCAGTAFVDCTRCEPPQAAAELARLRDEKRAAGEKLAQYERELGRPLKLIESANFVLVFELEALKVERKLRANHELLHLYAQRLEAARAAWLAALQASPGDFRSKTRVFVWALPRDHEQAALRYCGHSERGGVKLMGVDPVYSTCAGTPLLADEEIHRDLLHNLAHLLLSHQIPTAWIGNTGGGWADEGLAHWLELRMTGSAASGCNEEQAVQPDLPRGAWAPAVRKLVASGQAPPFAELLRRNSETLSVDEHLVAYSAIEYLIERDGPALNRLLKRLRARVPLRDALRETHGLDPLEFEAQWKAWVQSPPR